MKNKFLKLLFSLTLFVSVFTGCEDKQNPNVNLNNDVDQEIYVIDENGSFTSKEDVSLFIHIYDKLPSNYITKGEAYDLGWNSKEGNLWEVAEGKSIGGDEFGNYEGSLPKKDGRQYYECDIDYEGGYRNAKRIVYSNDGLIYYTEDHYKTFEEIVYDEN